MLCGGKSVPGRLHEVPEHPETLLKLWFIYEGKKEQGSFGGKGWE